MNPVEFDIIFRGDIVFGHQLSDVKQRLQQLFKSDTAKVDALFTGRPVPLKRNLDEATANKYREVLLKAGAQVELCPSGGVKVTSEVPVAARQPANNAAVKPSAWSLAPAGSDLLMPAERPPVSPVHVNTDTISLRPAGGNLLDMSEVPPTAVASVAVPDYALAEVGADLVREDEKMLLPLVEIEGGDWDLAEVGADLIAPEDRLPEPVPLIIPSDFGLAPLGSNLNQLKPEIKPLIPDISGIHLADG